MRTKKNPSYDTLFVTVNTNRIIGGRWFFIGQQFKWTEKRRLEDGCTTWSYLVKETARGECLDNEDGYWLSEEFCVEEEALGPDIKTSMYFERRDDGGPQNYDTDLPHHLRPPKEGVTDRDGFLILN